jgi:hypothetical protein
MSHKRKGQLTTSGEWARHLRPFYRKVFWKRERQAEQAYIVAESAELALLLNQPPAGTLKLKLLIEQ